MLFGFNHGPKILRAPEDDKGSGGAGGADDKGKDDKNAADSAALAKENADLKAKLAEFEKSKTNNDKSLNDKVKDQNDEKAKTKSLESSIRFNLSSDQFLKDNLSLLPKNAADILKAAGKETYDSEVNKANAVKSSLIQSFFEIQDNLDLLTPAQKIGLEDYLKLTKNGKEEKANGVWENIFEPSLEMLKRVKKAAEVGRGKGAGAHDSQDDEAYKQKLIDVSQKHYLGAKK